MDIRYEEPPTNLHLQGGGGGDWLEKMRGNLMVVATVFATMSFQVAVSPPGGVWSNSYEAQCPSRFNQPQNQGMCNIGAGTSVLSYTRYNLYIALIISSTISFSASTSIILLLVSGLRLRNRFVMTILILFMVVAVFCMSATFMMSVLSVRGGDDKLLRYIAAVYIVFWLVFPMVVVLIKLIWLVFVMLKKIFKFLLCIR